ncbi:hypothetical protein D9M68_862700 [compost metagenome]
MNFLEQLAQLAGEHDLACRSKDLEQRLDGLDDAMRRFIEHQRRGESGQSLQCSVALLCLRGQEAGEMELVVDKAAG